MSGSEELVVHSLSPHLVCDGAIEAIDFYTRAFGAVETLRIPAPTAG